MAISSRELAQIEGLLTGASSRPMGAFGKGGGVPRSDIEESLRFLLGDEDFVEDITGRLHGGELESLKRDRLRLQGARGKTAKKMKALRGKAGLGGSTGAGLMGWKNMGLLGRLGLIGGGIGTGLLVLDLLKLLKGQGEETQVQRRLLRENAGMNQASILAGALKPDMGERLNTSSKLRQLAAMGQKSGLGPSDELKNLLSSQDFANIMRMRQKASKPGLQEAYARAGLIG